jgi:RNA polymerase sigma factor (sigma-70 family)
MLAPWDSLCDPDIFARFHRAHVRACTRLVTHRCKKLAEPFLGEVQFKTMVDDAVADAFLLVKQRFELPDTDRSHPLALLVCVAHRQLLRQLRPLRRYLERRRGLEELEHTSLPVSINDSWLGSEVHSVLDTLPPRQAQAMTAHYLEDRPLRDIAATLDTTEAGVKGLLQRGRHEFRVQWQEGGSSR